MSPLCSRGAGLAPVALALVVAALALAGCTEVEPESAAEYEPSKLESIGGAGGSQRVSFTAEGARRIGLRTAAVRRGGKRQVVPYAALLYDTEGKTYVYTSPKPLQYVRDEVTVTRIADDRVLVSGGPPPGTRIVTVGATEVYGTELEVPSK